MSEKSDERFFDLVEETAREQGFQDFKVEVNPGSDVGVNYLGEVLRVKVTGKKNGISTSNVYFLKLIPNGSIHRRIGVPIVFKQEVEVYTEILPMFDSLAEEYRCDVFNHAPLRKSRLVEFKEVMIMDDLTLENYDGNSQGFELDLEHATLVLQKLGHLHALSFAARQHRPAEFKKLIAKNWCEMLLDSKINPFSGKVIYDSTEHALKYMEKQESIEATKAILSKVHETVKNLFKVEEIEPFAVLNHADVWSNNIMYKYKNNKLQDIILLDYQTPRYCSPVLDLFFFLFTSTDDAVRASHLKELFEIYYTSLRTKMRELECDPDTMYPRKVFYEHLKKFCPVSLVNAFIMMPIFMATKHKIDKTQSPNLLDENVKGVLAPITDSLDLYKRRVNAILNDCLNHGFL